MINYKVGLQNVGSYQVSGRPWITGSVVGLAIGEQVHHAFPFVAKSVLVINTDAGNDDLRVHFNATGSGNVTGSGQHYVALNDNKDSITFNTKCRGIYLSAPRSNAAAVTYTVVAELTSITADSMFDLTGSGLTD